jgi:hypothetical protein
MMQQTRVQETDDSRDDNRYVVSVQAFALKLQMHLSFAIRTSLALCIMAFVSLASSGAEEVDDKVWEKLSMREEQEAKDLFKVVLAEIGRKPQRCELFRRWPFYTSIPYNTAHRYLGHNVYGKLRAPERSVIPNEILDPEGKFPESFCDYDEFEQEQIIRDKELTERRDAIRSDRYVMPQLSYTFPAFDKSFRTAIIMAFSSRESWSVAGKDEVQRESESYGFQQIYRKQNGRWRLLKVLD